MGDRERGQHGMEAVIETVVCMEWGSESGQHGIRTVIERGGSMEWRQ